jgi:ubiquinone/menaquinone biosynthesis C-methylase UbiE
MIEQIDMAVDLWPCRQRQPENARTREVPVDHRGSVCYLIIMRSHAKVTPERIMQVAWGYAPPLIIEAAVKHGVFDSLDQSPKTAQQIARQTRASERGIRAILNALVGLRLLARKGTRYALTSESATFLVSGKPSYCGAFFHHTNRDLIPKWLQLSDIVRTGKPAMAVNAETDGARFFAEFVEALFPLNYAAARALGEHLQISKASGPVNVLDLAAGSGVWGIALAQQSSQVQMTAVDWPEVLNVTRQLARRHGLGDRLRTIPGDLLKVNYGNSYHIATLGHILHSEGRERSRRLLRKTFQALSPGGTIAIAEFVVNQDRTGPPMPLLFAVNMLVNSHAGDTFSFEEISGWLREAGFKKPRLLDVPAISPLVLATKP